MLRGLWPEAEQEARHACEELERFRIMDAVGFAHYEVGEVRLRMGDLAAAAEAFDRAYEYGHDAQPGLALLQLAHGDVDEAARVDRSRSLAAMAAPTVPLRSSGGPDSCPLRWRSRWRGGTRRPPSSAVEELEAIATEVGRPAFEAAALTARGELLLQQDEPAEAVPVLGRAWRLWPEVDLPYESARARELYGKALVASGRPGRGSSGPAGGPRLSFERLGASLDLQRVEELLGDDEGRAGSRRPPLVRTFMFTDIVTSSDLVGLIGDEAWEKLLRWHDRELRASFAQQRRGGGQAHGRRVLRGLRACGRRGGMRGRHPASTGPAS